MCRLERWDEAEGVAVEQLRVCHPEGTSMIAFTERFAVIVRERCGAELSAWLADAEMSGIRELRPFVRRRAKTKPQLRQARAALVERAGGRTGQSAQDAGAADARAGEVRPAAATDARRGVTSLTKLQAEPPNRGNSKY